MQGLAEFLPISSSGHLVLAEYILNIKENQLVLNIILHVGTLLAVCIYLRKDLIAIVRGMFSTQKNEKKESFQRITTLTVGTLPAVIAALFLKDRIEGFFRSPDHVGGLLIINAAILSLAHFLSKDKGQNKSSVTIKDAFCIGIAQASAILPGISRSGATISMGLMLGIEPRKAFTFSFLLSIPAIVGAVFFDIPALVNLSAENTQIIIAALGVAFITGLGALCILKKVVLKNKLIYFALYCVCIGIVIITI